MTFEETSRQLLRTKQVWAPTAGLRLLTLALAQKCFLCSASIDGKSVMIKQELFPVSRFRRRKILTKAAAALAPNSAASCCASRSRVLKILASFANFTKTRYTSSQSANQPAAAVHYIHYMYHLPTIFPDSVRRRRCAACLDLKSSTKRTVAENSSALLPPPSPAPSSSSSASSNKILSIVKSAQEGEKKRFNLHNTLFLK